METATTNSSTILFLYTSQYDLKYAGGGNISRKHLSVCKTVQHHHNIRAWRNTSTFWKIGLFARINTTLSYRQEEMSLAKHKDIKQGEHANLHQSNLTSKAYR